MEPREILPHTRSVAAAAGAFVTSAGVVTLTAGIVFDARLPGLGQAATIAVGSLFALGLLAIALRLLASRGGLLLDEERGLVGLGVTSERDIWWIPREDIAGLRVFAEARAGETIEAWLTVLELRGRASVVLARSDDRALVEVIARRLAEALGVDDLATRDDEDDPADDAEAPAVDAEAPDEPTAVRRLDFAVQRGAALQGILFFFGMSLTTIGAAMFSRVAEEPVFGFVFGPLLGLLGLALLAATFVKRFAVEELLRDGDRFNHGFRLGRLRWAHRDIQARAPRWHIYLHGMRGAYLQLVGADGSLVVGGGATSLSRADIDALSRVPTRLQSS